MDNYLLVDSQGNATEVTGETKIGRSKTNEVVLTDPLASRHHATVYLEGEQLMIRDEGSVNGTIVNGGQIYEPAQLQDQDQIQFGDEVLTVRAPLAELKTIKAGKLEPEGLERDLFQENIPPEERGDETLAPLQREMPTAAGTGTPLGGAPPKKGSQRTILIFAIVLIVLCLCCVVTFLIFRAVTGTNLQGIFDPFTWLQANLLM